MFSLIAKKHALPAVRPQSAPSASNALWGGVEEMDRMFDRLFHGFDQTLVTSGWKAPLAVWENKDNFYVEVELPGIQQDAVDVTVENRELSIVYTRKIPEDRPFICNERAYGCFERRLALPDSVNVDSIKAEMHDGMLQITLCKTPEAQPRKIAVQTR